MEVCNTSLSLSLSLFARCMRLFVVAKHLSRMTLFVPIMTFLWLVKTPRSHPCSCLLLSSLLHVGLETFFHRSFFSSVFLSSPFFSFTLLHSLCTERHHEANGHTPPQPHYGSRGSSQKHSGHGDEQDEERSGEAGSAHARGLNRRGTKAIVQRV